MDQPEPTDEALAAEAAREQSDGPAIVELVRRYQDRVWRVCYRLMGNREDAHDAAQEVLVRMFTCRSQFGGRSRYSTWVHGVALRTCLALRRAHGRRRRRVVSLPEEQLPTTTSPPADRRTAEKLDLAEMLSTLDEEDRALLILKYSEGHTHQELAEVFDLSTSACKMRIQRAREKLKDRFPDALD